MKRNVFKSSTLKSFVDDRRRFKTLSPRRNEKLIIIAILIDGLMKEMTLSFRSAARNQNSILTLQSGLKKYSAGRVRPLTDVEPPPW